MTCAMARFILGGRRAAGKVGVVSLFCVLTSASAWAANPAGTATLAEEGQGEAKRVVLENDFLRAVIAPSMGARVESLVLKSLGREVTVAPADGVRWGLLSDQLWQQDFWHSDWNRNPYQVLPVEKGPDRARVIFVGKGRLWEGVTLRKMVTLEARRAALDVEYTLTSAPSAHARGAGDLWIHNALPAGARVFLPSESGVLERPLTIEPETNVFNPTHGWIAGVMEGGSGLAAVMEYARLRNLRTCREAVTSLEWVLRKVSLKPGSTVKTEVSLLPFARLSRVDAACRSFTASLDLTDGAAGLASAVVKILPAENGTVEVAPALRRLPDGVSRPLGAHTISLKTGEIVADALKFPLDGEGSFVFQWIASAGGKRIAAIERLITVGKPSGAYATAPEGPTLGEYPDYPTWQRHHPIDFNFNSMAVRTPHRVWAKPYAGGRPRVLVLVPRHHARQAIELAQRFDIEITVPFLTDKTYYALGDRYRSLNQKDVNAAMEEIILNCKFDVVITANHGGWPLLTKKCAEYVIQRVKAGAGMILCQRGKLT